MRTRLRLKLNLALLFAALACGPAAMTAPAQGQGGQPQHYSYSNQYAAGEACAFPVRIEVTGKEKLIFLPGGRIIVASPGLRAAFTNLDTGRQSTESITGAIRVTFLENGDAELVFTGRNFLEGFGPPLPFLALTVGQLGMTLDPVGDYSEPPSGSAKVVDVCSLID